MTDKQQPPAVPERIWIDGPLGESGAMKVIYHSPPPTGFHQSAEFARVHPVDDPQVEEIRERLAALCHEQWSGWMRYLFYKCETEILSWGTLTKIPDNYAQRWRRQMDTPYSELSEQEKNADRKEADRFLALLPQLSSSGRAEVEQLNQRIAELERRLRIPFGKFPCALCGGPHDFDTSVPSIIWNSVIRAKDLPDYLCTTCIVREFVREGQSFTATLWNEEFNGTPIEVMVNGQNARDAAAIQEENNSLRNQLSSSEPRLKDGGAEDVIGRDAAMRAMCTRCANPERYGPAQSIEGSERLWHFQIIDGWNAGPCDAAAIIRLPRATAPTGSSERRCGEYNEGFNDAAAVARTLNSVAATGVDEGEPRESAAREIVNRFMNTISEGDGDRSCNECGLDTYLCPHLYDRLTAMIAAALLPAGTNSDV